MGCDRASRVSWAWRFCDWSKPVRRFGREASSFQLFTLDEFRTLEERLKEELVEHVEDSNGVELVGTVRDLSLALTELTGDLPWDLPELRSPTKSHSGRKQRAESKQIDSGIRNYIFVLQPCPQTDSQWNLFCERSTDVLKKSLFPPALYTQLHNLRIAVHWVNTGFSSFTQEGAMAEELYHCLGQTLSVCGGGLIPSSLLVSAGLPVGLSHCLHYLPVSSVMSYFMSSKSVESDSEIESQSKELSWLCSSAGEPVCILEVCSTPTSLSCPSREPRLQHTARSRVRKLNVRKEGKCSVPFPDGLVMEGTLAKTGLCGLMDVLDKSHLFSCIGLEHNVQQNPPGRKKIVGSRRTNRVENEASQENMSSCSSAVAGDGVATKLPNPNVHLETHGRIQSKKFQSLLMVLAEKQLVLVLRRWDSIPLRYILDPTTLNSASLRLLDVTVHRPEWVSDTKTSSCEKGKGPLAESGGAVFDCVEPWYRLMPQYGVDQSTVSYFRNSSTLDTTLFAKDLRATVSDLKTAYREELRCYPLKEANSMQKPSDGDTISGDLGDNVGDDLVAAATSCDVFAWLRCQMLDLLNTDYMNINLEQAVPGAVYSACEKLQHLSDNSKREVCDFITEELLLSADQLKAKYQGSGANKEARAREHQLQVLLRFELAVLDESTVHSDMFTECVTILRALLFLTSAETLRKFLDETILRRYGGTVRCGVLSVYQHLVPEPPQVDADATEGSDSEEDRLERMMSLRSYTLVKAPSAPKLPSVERSHNLTLCLDNYRRFLCCSLAFRKFSRHSSFHDYGKQHEISVRAPPRKKQHKGIGSKPVADQVAEERKMKRRSQTAAETLCHKNERSRRAVRRTLFSSLAEGIGQRKGSPRGGLKRALTFPGCGSIRVPESKRLTRRSARDHGIIVEETPLKQQKRLNPSARKLPIDIDPSNGVLTRTVQDTPKRNFYSRSFSEARMLTLAGGKPTSASVVMADQTSPFVVTADQYASDDSLVHSKYVQDQMDSKTVVLMNTREQGRLTKEYNSLSHVIQRSGTQNDMAEIMFQQQEVLLGPSVGPQPDQSMSYLVTPKGPSPLQLSKLLHSPMQGSPQMGEIITKESPLVGSVTASAAEAIEADIVFDCDEEGSIALENGEYQFHLKV